MWIALFHSRNQLYKAACRLHSRGLPVCFIGAPALESALGLGTYPMESTWAVTDSRRRFLTFRSRVLMHDVKSQNYSLWQEKAEYFLEILFRDKPLECQVATVDPESQESKAIS